jgi:hypothetical protein
VNISETDYPHFTETFNFSVFTCPHCGSEVKYHATYEKKLYSEALIIRRVRCTNKACRRTHAVIPTFSVPCCSIGTKEVDTFLIKMSKGSTVEEAGQCFVDQGMSPDYPESIHRRLTRYRPRIETIFSPLKGAALDYSHLILSLIQNKSNPTAELNCLCYDKRFNPVLFSRVNILVLSDYRAETAFSHNSTFSHPP